MLRLGCFLKLIPYRFEVKTNQLTPPSKLGLISYTFHKYITYLYTTFMWIRLVQAYLDKGFSVSLMPILWAVTNISVAVGYVMISICKDDIMHFTNRLLTKKLWMKDTEFQEFQRAGHIQKGNILGRHMIFNLLLLYINPQMHSILIYNNPCSPNFLTSLYFSCISSSDNKGSFLEKFPFLIFEFYVTAKWEYMCSLMWSMICMGLVSVTQELKKFHAKFSSATTPSALYFGEMKERIKEDKRFLHIFRKCELVVSIMNRNFYYYLLVQPILGICVVALLLYGVICYWRVDRQAYIMFPMCVLRCGFEAVTPIALAAKMHSASNNILQEWKQIKCYREDGFRSTDSGNKGADVEWKAVNLARKSCKSLTCTSGPLYPFKDSVALETVDKCIQHTVNFLVAFR